MCDVYIHLFIAIYKFTCIYVYAYICESHGCSKLNIMYTHVYIHLNLMVGSTYIFMNIYEFTYTCINLNLMVVIHLYKNIFVHTYISYGWFAGFDHWQKHVIRAYIYIYIHMT